MMELSNQSESHSVKIRFTKKVSTVKLPIRHIEGYEEGHEISNPYET